LVIEIQRAFGGFFCYDNIMKFIPKIGLEIHAELKTKTKMFCNSPNNPNEKRPNVNVCPVCMGHPGTLPVINKEAIKSVLRTGLAINGKLADYTQFDRKNYFYPDLPKGYQISQYKFPLVKGGGLNNIKITQIHLEEDAGKLVHFKDYTGVDFNRAGVPLMELVTEPDITSAKQARIFAEELRLLLRYLDVSEANMEQGQMRIEANVSLGTRKREGLELAQEASSPEHFAKQNVLGTKVEVKNLNSFKIVEQVIDYEIERQRKVLEKEDKVIQETRGWDEKKQKTFSQRSKEEAHDYRYFPEPDLPPLQISKIEEFRGLEATIPELPWQKRGRLQKEYGIPENIINNFVNDPKLASFFENVISETRAEAPTLAKSEVGVPIHPKDDAGKRIITTTINYLTSDLIGLMKEKCLSFDNLLVGPEDFSDLIELLSEDKISSRVAKDVLKEMVETGVEPHVVIKEKGLEQTSNLDAIGPLAQKAINENPKAIEDYKKGKEASIQFLIGVIMKETRGSANPQKVREILEKLLK